MLFEELLGRWPGYELAGPVERLPSRFVRGIGHLPLCCSRSCDQSTAVTTAAGTHMRMAAPPIVSAPMQKATAARWNTWAW